jgi:hypothetical protein
LNRIAITVVAIVSVTSVWAADKHSAFTLPSGVKVEIVEGDFTDSGFAASECNGQSAKCRINGHIPFGNALTIPKSYVKKLDVSYSDRSYSLDVSNMYNAWGGRPLESRQAVRYFGGRCDDQENCRFRGLFSDAAGAFAAEWVVMGGLSARTVLTDSSDILKLFREHIDPPEFQ